MSYYALRCNESFRRCAHALPMHTRNKLTMVQGRRLVLLLGEKYSRFERVQIGKFIRRTAVRVAAEVATAMRHDGRNLHETFLIVTSAQRA